eukprot:2417251-Pyramimonas_sp.AAC.1
MVCWLPRARFSVRYVVLCSVILCNRVMSAMCEYVRCHRGTHRKTVPVRSVMISGDIPHYAPH